ncbi:hypothetical protein [Pedobacter sp. MR2016-24]|uniref:hypothetical protein n=1 Tax=Pedobacter sp. MR2016-24 TaxID=2994466 RepID=UPI002245F2F2|nr:hypothetical protein [Pedobacter sp. MR2016-24]MCX2483215.1 hypothetical protein [Pedobacter sp. MR2016-24]
MGLFSLDFERLYQHFQAQGGQLKGIFCIQYPIYCIHANISDVTPDALENVDRVICDFYKKNHSFTPFQIGSLIGTSKTFVEIRIQVLLRDGLIKKIEDGYQLTDAGRAVFDDKIRQRQYSRTFDFYLDGVSLAPLPKVFYTFYRSKLISENDVRYFTGSDGETRTSRPFGPDIVHTPPDKDLITEKIFGIPLDERDEYNIPTGLVSIEDSSFTKQTFQVLVAVSFINGELTKEIIDGFAYFSLAEGLTYYETIKKNIRIFENGLNDKIQNLEFKITIPAMREDTDKQPKPIITSNWGEIDRYKNSKNKCFSFSSEDLMRVITDIFKIKDVSPESVVNEESNIEISLTKEMLMSSSDRGRLIENLIRQRDYYIGNIDRNVFLVYLYFKTTDDFVQQVLKFKKLIKENKKSLLTHTWFTETYPAYKDNFREMLTAVGEIDLLEKIDIECFMAKTT